MKKIIIIGASSCELIEAMESIQRATRLRMKDIEEALKSMIGLSVPSKEAIEKFAIELNKIDIEPTKFNQQKSEVNPESRKYKNKKFR